MPQPSAAAGFHQTPTPINKSRLNEGASARARNCRLETTYLKNVTFEDRLTPYMAGQVRNIPEYPKGDPSLHCSGTAVRPVHDHLLDPPHLEARRSGFISRTTACLVWFTTVGARNPPGKAVLKNLKTKNVCKLQTLWAVTRRKKRG